MELLVTATKWFKEMVSSKGIDEAIVSMRQKPFEVPWVHDLLYDRYYLFDYGVLYESWSQMTNLHLTLSNLHWYHRLKLLKKGIHNNWDENTYTSLWITPGIIALYTGIDNLISFVYANGNHYTPSSWRRSLVREQANSKGTNFDGCSTGRDGMIDLILENVGSPACSNHAKKLGTRKNASGMRQMRCWSGTTSRMGLLASPRSTLSSRWLSMVGERRKKSEEKGDEKEQQRRNIDIKQHFVTGYEMSLYATSILGLIVYQVKKIFHGHYHGNKDTYLSRVLVHLKLCLLLKVSSSLSFRS